MHRIALAGLGAGILLLGACGRSTADVGGVSPEDAALLNNAAETLDASPDGLTAPANDAEGGAAANAVDPPQEPNAS